LSKNFDHNRQLADREGTTQAREICKKVQKSRKKCRQRKKCKAARGAELPGEGEKAKPMPPVALQPIIQTWYRRLSLRYHPDRGGSDAAMRVVNNARDLLLELLAS
jgi:hypothetical protein